MGAPAPATAPGSVPPPPRKSPPARSIKEDEVSPSRQPAPGPWHFAGRLSLNLVLISLALAPAFLTARLLSAEAVNTPFGEDWRLVDLLERQSLGQMAWTDLWRPVHGERSLLPQAVHLAAFHLTGGDARTAAWVNFAWISLTSLGVLLLLLRTVGGGFGTGLLYLIANLALFSPAQHLLSVRQSAIFLPVTCLVWGLLIASLRGSATIKFAACAAATIAAATSGIHGLALFGMVPAIAGGAVGLPRRVRPVGFTLAWTVFAAAFLLVYFTGWSPIHHSGPPPEAAESLPALETGFTTAFQLIAAPLVEGWTWAGPVVRLAVGAALATALLAMLSWSLAATPGGHHPLSGVRSGPWLILGGSGLTGVGLIVAARLVGSADGPLSTEAHFGHAVIPVLLGALVPFHLLARERIVNLRPRAFRILPALIHAILFGSVIGLQTEGWFRGTEEIRMQHRERLRARVSLHLCEVFAPDQPEAFGTSAPDTIIHRARFLQEAGYLDPALLTEPAWPPGRIAPGQLSLLLARVEPPGEGTGTLFRVVARLPGPGRRLDPVSGIVLTRDDPEDETRTLLLSRGIPDPADAAQWHLDLSALPAGVSGDIRVIDGRDMLAYRLEQRPGRDASGAVSLNRGSPENPPASGNGSGF